ncbi:MAG: hypothetical protein PHQ86_05365 [Dehalococcoidales bacterium]|nr:hypothetical protein [Dehalococcoidales bacterium]
MVNDNHMEEKTRQERREKRLQKKRERIIKHGKNLADIYNNAIMKRLKRNKKDR